ncbi:MAG: hypothetical protein JO144_04540 [Actinobacteria bacterium]|nr:hypothetical protein [Actinomycetota bacterium]
MEERESAYRGSDDMAQLAETARVLREKRTGLVLTGRISNGRVELDQDSLDHIQRNFPDADVSFVAVNAPFDPHSQLV